MYNGHGKRNYPTSRKMSAKQLEAYREQQKSSLRSIMIVANFKLEKTRDDFYKLQTLIRDEKITAAEAHKHVERILEELAVGAMTSLARAIEIEKQLAEQK